MEPFIVHHNPEENSLLHFWGIGDLHYRATEPWHTVHTQRLQPLFTDLQELWQTTERPAFSVSPGDVIETCATVNYRLAHDILTTQLAGVPFFPGVGNHEYFQPEDIELSEMASTFTHFWQKPVRYAWEQGDFVFIMLDYPNPYTLADARFVFISQETLSFLDRTLAEHATQQAIVFLHCPLYNTVLARDPRQQKDYSSAQYFFSPENSQEIRAVLARHSNAVLFISGHTHSGLEAPNLILTEELGGHPVTFVNLMSPWYTGRNTGLRPDPDDASLHYVPDDPNVIPTFSFRLYADHVHIRIREHLSKTWLQSWNAPFHM